MPFERDIFKTHMDKAEKDLSDYDRFDSLWKAFNVYYESCYKKGEGFVREIDLIRRAVNIIPKNKYANIVAEKNVRQLLSIKPIFNERNWQRKGIKDASSHLKVKKQLEQISNGAKIELQHIESLVELLYMVRCNMAHGFKTPEGPRDREVLSAAVGALNPFMNILAKCVL